MNRTHTLVGTTAALLLSLTACGGGGGGRSALDVTDGQPDCSDVWQAGKTLPTSYEGCTRPDGDLEAGVLIDCKTGPSIANYHYHRWGFLGGHVRVTRVDYGKDPGYKRAYWRCVD